MNSNSAESSKGRQGAVIAKLMQSLRESGLHEGRDPGVNKQG